MNDSESIDLAAMLCSRLCHDMLSPVGALSNGLELLSMETDPEMRRSVIELLEQSSRTSTNKLKFFRLAFGAAGGFGDRVDVQEPKALIEALVADKDKVRGLHEESEMDERSKREYQAMLRQMGGGQQAAGPPPPTQENKAAAAPPPPRESNSMWTRLKKST